MLYCYLMCVNNNMHVKLQSYLGINDCSLSSSVWNSRTDFFFLCCLYAPISIYQQHVLYFFHNYLFFPPDRWLLSWFFQFTHTFTQIHCFLFWSFYLTLLFCLGSVLEAGYFCWCLDHFSSIFCKHVHSWAYFCKTFIGG